MNNLLEERKPKRTKRMSAVIEQPETETVDSLLDESLPPLDGAADLSDDEPDVDSQQQTTRLEKLLSEIAEAEMLCANAEEAVNEAKAVLKEAKADYDGCVLKLRKLAKAVRNDEDRPLFDGLSDESDEDDGDYSEALKESISVLGLPAGLVSKLEEENVETIGDLEQLREDITLGRKQWPKGIGPAKVDLIETTVVEWLADHCDDGTAEPEDDDETDEGDD